MALGEFKPGDKIATCPYCQTIVDLPDQPAGTHETVVEEEEETIEDGKTTRRTVRRVTRTTGSTSSDSDMASMTAEGGILSGLDGDVQARVQAMLDKTQNPESDANATVTTRSRRTLRSHDDLMGMANDMLSNPPDGNTVTREDVSTSHSTTVVEHHVSEPAKKPSFWKRLFGKK